MLAAAGFFSMCEYDGPEQITRFYNPFCKVLVNKIIFFCHNKLFLHIQGEKIN